MKVMERIEAMITLGNFAETSITYNDAEEMIKLTAGSELKKDSSFGLEALNNEIEYLETVLKRQTTRKTETKLTLICLINDALYRKAERYEMEMKRLNNSLSTESEEEDSQ